MSGLSTLTAGIESALDALGLKKDSVPWDMSEKNAFWSPLEIDPDRWDKMYPYRLLVIDIKTPDKILLSGDVKVATKLSEGGPSAKGIEYVLSQEIVNGSWEFNLPITPQMLRISDQFASNVSATMRGVVEEHNGVKFKTISASGSMGVWALKPTIGGVPKSPSSLSSIFGGTANAFSNVLNDIKRTKNAFAGKHPASVTNALRPGSVTADSFVSELSTGYYQALLMGQFLERYAEAKKDPKNKDWRLVFDIPKQNQSFIVTPVLFNLEQNQQKPMEALWNIQFKAWKRINLTAPASAGTDLPSLDTNTFQRIVGTIRETRRVLGNSISLIKAVRSDFQKPLNILRQTALAVKDLGGLAFTAIDLPRQVLDDFSSTITDSLNIVGNSFKRGPSGGSTGTSATGVSASGIRADTQEARAGIAASQILNQSQRNEGLSQSAVESGALGLSASQSLDTDATKGIFSSPEEYFDLFDVLDVEDLSLSREQQEAVDNEIDNVRLITVSDLQDFKEELVSLAYDISDNFGSGDQTYSDVYGKPDPTSRVLPMTLEEDEILASLFESIQVYDLLTATREFDDLTIPSTLEYVGGLANEAGIDFDQTQSKLLVPVPFGLTIEEIAARYLKDPDKWVEIATINNLSSPYIDEEGFDYLLLSNGDGRQINVDDTEGKLYIGQKITLKSDTIPTFARKIIDIEKIGDGNYLISVDGLGDLSTLTTNNNATIQAYLPGTTNSQNQIYIPSNEAAQEDDRIRTPSHLDEDALARISKVDWLLTDDGDLAINQLGDFRLASGLNNLVQALRIKIRVKKGSLMRHLDFGLGLKHGMSMADIENGSLIKAMNSMINEDPRFSGIERMSIKLNGVTLSVDMAVRIANGSGVVPITFNV